MNAEQAPAGWYPVDDNKLRYWDGATWTEHLADNGQAVAKRSEASSGRLQNVASAAARGLTAEHMDLPEGTIWSSIGKGMGGIVTGRYRLDIHYLYASKGALRTDAHQVPIADVFDVDVRQSMTQKARGVFTVLVHVNRGGVREVMRLEDIHDGPGGQRIINQTARDARLMLEHRSIHIDGLRHQATSTVRQEIAYEGLSSSTPAMMPTQALPFVQVTSSTTSASEALPEIEIEAIDDKQNTDPIAQLRELGSLRDAGILTNEEFDAKKTEILKRL